MAPPQEAGSLVWVWAVVEGPAKLDGTPVLVDSIWRTRGRAEMRVRENSELHPGWEIMQMEVGA